MLLECKCLKRYILEGNKLHFCFLLCAKVPPCLGPNRELGFCSAKRKITRKQGLTSGAISQQVGFSQ
jgi:hypothetical protein